MNSAPKCFLAASNSTVEMRCWLELVWNSLEDVRCGSTALVRNARWYFFSLLLLRRRVGYFVLLAYGLDDSTTYAAARGTKD